MSNTFRRGDERRQRATDRRRARHDRNALRLYSGARLDLNGNEREGGAR